MDDILKKALDFSNYNQTLNIQRKSAKEKYSSKMIVGHAGGLFNIDRELIVFVQMLINQNRIENIPLIDSNNNPVMIKDMQVFRDEIFDRSFSATLEYYNEYEKIKKSRSVEKLVDL